MTKIDFLGIGAQKSATSWLSQNLRDHPDIWMPPRKELHYFDRSLKYISPSYLATDNYQERKKGLEKHNVLFRKKMNNELELARRSGNKKVVDWFENYFCKDISDDWYQSLFIQGGNKKKGEITPSYSILTIEDIKHIKGLFPDLKLIFLLRDPIERAWSQLRFLIKTGRFSSSISIEEIKSFIDSDFQTSRGDYLGILSRWQSVFLPSQFFIAYYDEVVESPKALLSRLFNFLSLNPDKSSFLSLHKKSNVSPTIEIPNEIKEYLISKYYDEIERLISLSHSIYPVKWLNKYKS